MSVVYNNRLIKRKRTFVSQLLKKIIESGGIARQLVVVCVFYICLLLISADDQLPWVGAGIGIVLGAVILIANYLYAAKPTVGIKNKVLLTCK